MSANQMLRITANLDTLFKLLDWIIYLCLCTIAVIFFWHELEQFHSKYSSFKEYEESIQESPAIVFCFDPFKKITNVATNDENSLALDPYKVKHYEPYKLGVDFNISYN